MSFPLSLIDSNMLSLHIYFKSYKSKFHFPILSCTELREPTFSAAYGDLGWAPSCSLKVTLMALGIDASQAARSTYYFPTFYIIKSVLPLPGHKPGFS